MLYVILYVILYKVIWTMSKDIQTTFAILTNIKDNVCCPSSHTELQYVDRFWVYIHNINLSLSLCIYIYCIYFKIKTTPPFSAHWGLCHRTSETTVIPSWVPAFEALPHVWLHLGEATDQLAAKAARVTPGVRPWQWTALRPQMGGSQGLQGPSK